jgi:DNA primase
MNIRDVLDRVDLASVLTELAGEPASAGRLPRWRCCSTDHSDEHPSVTMFRDRQGVERWKCWSGGHGGTAVDAVMSARRVDVATALRMLEERAGLTPLTPPVGVPAAIRRGPQPFSAAALEYAQRCAELLWTPQGSDARAWLHARGLSDEVLKDHQVGFDPGVRALPRADGLPRTRLGVTYVSFTAIGSPCYVQVRHLHPGALSKYSNPTPTHGSKPAVTFTRIAAPGPLLVGEGVPDALVAASAGFRAAAIIDAASISPTTIDLLAAAAGTAGVVLALDNDPAGQEATRRLREGLVGRTSLQVLRLAPGFDLTDHYRARADHRLVAAR